ncbi:type II toxin-antitoxin system VapC family toxin [Methanospirillum stamsii]|uniref:type II toxin-antitoxin system VapC family toxin n=1 Tax=Methanospirillum stamsii TaxID=1277351 RepID=UPI0034E05FFA
MPVDEKVIISAHQLLTEFRINPRDALHAATAFLAGCRHLISEDNDFNRFSFITKKWMEL